MIRIRYILQSINVINSLLVLVVAAISYFTITPFLNLDVQMSLPQAKETSPASVEKPAAAQSPSPADYAVISDQNLFHPERKIPPEGKEEKAIPRPEVVLYGTLIADDMSIAYVEDKKAPYSTPGRGKRQIALKKGDHLGGYVLTQVEANRIILVKGDDKIVVMLNDGEKRKGGETQTSPGTSRSIPVAPMPSAFPSPAYPPAVPPSAPAVTSPGTATGPAGLQTPYNASRSRRPSVMPTRPVQ